MVALTPGSICHQIITFKKTLEKKVSLSSQYSQKSRPVGETLIRTLSSWLRVEGDSLAHGTDKARARWDFRPYSKTHSSFIRDLSLSS